MINRGVQEAVAHAKKLAKRKSRTEKEAENDARDLARCAFQHERSWQDAADGLLEAARSGAKAGRPAAWRALVMRAHLWCQDESFTKAAQAGAPHRSESDRSSAIAEWARIDPLVRPDVRSEPGKVSCRNYGDPEGACHDALEYALPDSYLCARCLDHELGRCGVDCNACAHELASAVVGATDQKDAGAVPAPTNAGKEPAETKDATMSDTIASDLEDIRAEVQLLREGYPLFLQALHNLTIAINDLTARGEMLARYGLGPWEGTDSTPPEEQTTPKPSPEAPEPPPPEPEPVSLDEVRKQAGLVLRHRGGQFLADLLKSYGASKLSELAEGDNAAFYESCTTSLIGTSAEKEG